MFRSWFPISCLAILLILSVIAPSGVGAATAPVVSALGQIDSDGLDAPTRLAVDGSGNVYVSDARAGKVVKYDKYGRLCASYAVSGFTAEGLAVASGGARLYVSAGTSVAVLDGASGLTLGALGDGTFERVGEIAVDETGFVFVADRGKCQIAVFDAAGEPKYIFGSKGAAAGQLSDIQALAINVATQEVLVVDSALSGANGAGISVFTYAGNFKARVTALGGGAVPQFAGLAVDGQGRVYVLPAFEANLGPAVVRVLGPTATAPGYAYLSSLVGTLSMPGDAVYDATTGRLFVALLGAARLELFGIDGGKSPEFVNHAPGMPALLSPVSGSEVAESMPQLSWKNAVDEDQDVLTYTVQLLKDGVASEFAGISAGDVESSYRLAAPLEENASYSWTVRASDGLAQSAAAEMQSFVVNAVQEAPGVVELQQPQDKAKATGSAVFAWDAAIDPDPADTVAYRVEIAADAAFADVVASRETGEISAPLAGFNGYGDLQDGLAYYWRVIATDNHGLFSVSSISSFVYDTTQLRVTSNVPGASVYFAGGYAYAGRYVGAAPVEQRDVVPGTVTIVVEHSGFEPWVGQAVIAEGESVTVAAQLQPALVPARHGLERLMVGKKRLTVPGGAASVFAVDYDCDGLVDLLVGDAAGKLQLFRGVAGKKGKLAFAASVELLTADAGVAAPFVVDWNNDGKQDLLVGGGDGAVMLYLNAGDTQAPQYAAGVQLVAGINSPARPTVIDLDGDGDKDLLVAGDNGVLMFVNNGTDAAPALAAGALFPGVEGRVSLTSVDWNSDGLRDLLVVNGKSVTLLQQSAEGGFVSQGVLTLPTAKLSGAIDSLFAADLNAAGGKDLLLGCANGEVVLLKGAGKQLLSSYFEALCAGIDALVADAPQLQPKLASLRSALDSGNLASARRIAARLNLVTTGDAEIDLQLQALARLLK